MKPTSEILERINKSSTNHNDGVFTKLYRYLLREEIYYAAYQKLYANKGAMTKGSDDDTADGFGLKYIMSLIDELKTLTYQPKPVRRKYIKKANGKMRPLGIPSFRDKLLQEAVRMILEAIYEPVFDSGSHGFRPNRSCHTALEQIKNEFRSTKWFIEGDIKGCFDNINHEKLIEILQRKIKDSKLINLIRMFLKAGYMEEFEYNQTMSGTPQGGIISPILANIYLNELDHRIKTVKAQFDSPAYRSRTVEYARLDKRCATLRRKIGKAKETEKPTLLAEYKATMRQKLKTPCRLAEDKKLVYVRYADDFLIGISGNREDCESIKAELKLFLQDKLCLELSEEKTLITHSANPIRFLGYDILVRRSQVIKKRNDGVRLRTMNNSVELTVPLKEKIEKFLFASNIVKQTDDGKLWPICRPNIRYKSDGEIVNIYNAELRGICNYYCKAVNYYKLNYFRYLMEYSCLKTIASKHNSTTHKIIEQYRSKDGWSIPYQTKQGEKMVSIAKLAECKAGKFMDDEMPKPYISYNARNLTIRMKLNQSKCEICGKTGVPCEIHHAGSLNTITGKNEWERKMLSMKRKTLVVCEECHKNIHGRT